MYLLDSSAWLIHLFGEPGVETVNQLFDDVDIDGLIAATAAVHGATLVHRDPHLAAIPDHLSPQIELPTE